MKLLRGLLLEGATSPPAVTADAEYLAGFAIGSAKPDSGELEPLEA